MRQGRLTNGKRAGGSGGWARRLGTAGAQNSDAGALHSTRAPPRPLQLTTALPNTKSVLLAVKNYPFQHEHCILPGQVGLLTPAACSRLLAMPLLKPARRLLTPARHPGATNPFAHRSGPLCMMIGRLSWSSSARASWATRQRCVAAQPLWVWARATTGNWRCSQPPRWVCAALCLSAPALAACTTPPPPRRLHYACYASTAPPPALRLHRRPGYPLHPCVSRV